MGANSPNEGRIVPQQPLEPEDPERIGGYEVLSRLGQGGMATVYLGADERGRRVAIKLIRPGLAAEPGFRERFEREAVYAKRVRQAYVAPVLEEGTHQGRPFLVTEYIEGPTVDEAVGPDNPMAAYEVEQLAEHVASALVAIHAAGVVHRDLKPSNVILGRTGPRVIDFGIARALDDSGGLTSQNVRLGTPSYMAPEQFDPDLDVDTPADVFAWGGLMVFASTGRPPFGRATNQREVAGLASRVATHEPRLEALDEPLRTVVRQAMAKDPARRPTARDLVRRLGGEDQSAPSGRAPEPPPTEPGRDITPPVPVAALTAAPPRPVPGPPPTAHLGPGAEWRSPPEVPVGRPRVLPGSRTLLVAAGIALLLITAGVLLWLNLPAAVRLLLKIGAGGLVVLGAIGAGIWLSTSGDRRRSLWVAGALVLFLLGAVLWFTYDQLHHQFWVGLEDDRVAVLEGAGPDGHMGVDNIANVEQDPADPDRSKLPALLEGALDKRMGVGNLNEGRRLANCFPWLFTPTADTPARLRDLCRTEVSPRPRELPVPDPDDPVVEATERTPAVAATDDRVLLAWTDSDTRLLRVGSSLNGVDFDLSTPPLGEAFQSDQEPALATDGSAFYLAWRDPSGHVAVASSTDGQDFGEPKVLVDTMTRYAPALAYGHGTLVLAWVAEKDTHLHLWPAADAAALDFVADHKRPLYWNRRREASKAAPNLLFKGELGLWYLTWAGTDGQVNIRTFAGDLEAGDKDILALEQDAPETRHRPAIAFLHVWIVGWTRPDGQIGLLISKSDQRVFVNQVTLKVRSGTGVNMTTFRGQVLLTWAGGEQQPGGHILRLP